MKLRERQVRVPSQEFLSKVAVCSALKNTTVDKGTSSTLRPDEMNVFDRPLSPLPSTTEAYFNPNIWGDDVVQSLGSQQEKCDEDTQNKLIEDVRRKLKSMDDGETLPSVYDTAWVARVPAVDGLGGPQFPRTVKWIIENQLQDGSWGEERCFLAYDRILNTLACIIALKTWNAGDDCIQKGQEFLSRNIHRLEDEVSVRMLSGFEIVFTSILDEATRLGLQLPYESPSVKKVIQAREKKMKRIPVEMFHSRHTTLLYCLEGLQSVIDWERIMKLQSKDGSFLSSPAATACVFTHTGDSKCLDFLNATLAHFNNEAVPCNYPIDLYERLWLVDTIDRLGIARFFETEIREVLDYVYSYWTPYGIGWARDNPVQDIDDTAMAFRLFRLYGYDVSADVFEHFKQDGKFFCFPGECRHGVSEMLNLFRASKVRFPGETVLEEAHNYSRQYLQAVGSTEAAHDKWSLKKDLPGEVAHSLRYSWHRALPRVDVREYLDQYGTDDLWIAKVIYRLPSVNNEKLLALAKADFNRCQAVHQREILELTRWWKEKGFADLPSFGQGPVESYFSWACAMFEPQFSAARFRTAQASILVVALNDLVDSTSTSFDELHVYLEAVKRWDPSLVSSLSQHIRILFKALHDTVNEWVNEASELQGRDMGVYLRQVWANLIASQVKEAEWAAAKYTPSLREYLDNCIYSVTNGTIVMNTLMFCGEVLTDEMLSRLDHRSEFLRLMCLASCLTKGSQTCKVAVGSYIRDHPSASEEEALEYLSDLKKNTLVELTHEFLRPDNPAPIACKRVIYDGLMATSMQLFRDISTHAHEGLKDLIRKVLIEPVA
uniref:8-endo-copalyl diphosphate synthase n=1 Tax=Osmunda sp. FC-2022a TaxID=2939422 RepID=A0A8U0DA95_9MONI|nr:8-endo-copalyl diphosphate synthase [Osmunda sp. FC-2022a]